MNILKEHTPRWIIFLIDLSIVFFSISLAFLLRFNFGIPDSERASFILLVIFIPLIRGISFIISKSYVGIIRYTSTKDAQRIFIINTSVSILLVLLNIATYIYDSYFIVPFSILIIEFFTSIFLMITFRIIVKITYFEINNPKKEKTNILIYGIGELAIITKRTIERDSEAKQNIKGFLCNKSKSIGQRLEGVQIFDKDDLVKIIGQNQITTIIFAKQDVLPEVRNIITEKCLSLGVEIKAIPEIKNWINGELSINQIKSIKIEQLLERPEINLSKDKIKDEIEGKTILITGAAGSIGSEIVRQISSFKPKKIVLYDQAESPMYDIELELNESFEFNDYKIIIGDIRDTNRLSYILERYKPDIIFHAAAYKHVPMMENNPSEATTTNIIGTKNLAFLADKYNVKRFVMVSTDKAVNPTNVMGASKRTAEIYVQSLNKKSNTLFITTRFGNVLGSNGSVIPRFKKQIEDGGPITVTHPDITRFFMTIPEACQLVMEAGATGNGGEIFVFDMGKSVKIADLAKKMIKLSGLSIGSDIEIKYTGLRPGEKLYEELLSSSENTIATHHEKIMKANVREYEFETISKQIEELAKLANEYDNYAIVKKIKEIVPEFISNNSVFEKLDKK